MTDEQIIQEMRMGNYSRAMKELYRHFAVVRAFVVKNSGSKQDAEDVFQEGLIILIRKLKQEHFQLTSSIGTFLIGICRYYWLGELRKHGKSLQVSVDEPAEHSELFSEFLGEEDRFRVAEQALLSIGEKCQELLRLFYHDRLDFTAIARRVGISNERVAKNQKYRCLEKARQKYSLLNAKSESE